MSKQSKAQQAALDELLERDKDILNERTKLQQSTDIEPELVVLAEFALYYGWDAMMQARRNEMSGEEFNLFILAARKLELANRYNKAIDMAYAFAGGDELNNHLSRIKSNI